MKNQTLNQTLKIANETLKIKDLGSTLDSKVSNLDFKPDPKS